jgi:hypothetical protein
MEIVMLCEEVIYYTLEHITVTLYQLRFESITAITHRPWGKYVGNHLKPPDVP